MRALAFDTEPLFWPFWHWTSRASLPDLHTAYYRFLKPTKISFCKIKNPPGSTTTQKKQTKWSYLHLLPASKKRLLKLPPQRTTHETEFSRIQESSNPGFIFGFWTSRFCITLELSGPRQRVRLNDLLCEPLFLAVNFYFDLVSTEPPEHHCPVCTMPTTDF